MSETISTGRFVVGISESRRLVVSYPKRSAEPEAPKQSAESESPELDLENQVISLDLRSTARITPEYIERTAEAYGGFTASESLAVQSAIIRLLGLMEEPA